MQTRATRPDDLARELGCDFTVEEPAKSNMPVQRFTFRFPPMDSPDYAEAVARVTLWSKRVRAWTFETLGPQPIVASEMTFGNRLKVALVNRKNRKLMRAFNTAEAQARRVAMSQPSPQQALKVLDEQAPDGREKATRQLRKAFEDAIKVLESPDGSEAVH